MKETGSHSTRSQNYSANGGPTRGGGGAKSTTDGKDTGGNATNRMAVWGCDPSEVSPSATSQSRNKSMKTGSY